MTDEERLIIKEITAKLRDALEGVDLALADACVITVYAEICAQTIKENAVEFEEFFANREELFCLFRDFVKAKLAYLNLADGRAQ